MRRILYVLVSLLAVSGTFACTPKATIQRSTPVANLRVYTSVMVRAAGSNQGPLANNLALRTAQYLQHHCQFAAVFTGEAATQPTAEIDLLVDLSILASARDTGGIVRNPNVAVVDVAMALSDVSSDELLGSASIRGQSPAVVSDPQPPEQVAIDAVAVQVGKIMVNSGCVGPRIARTTAEPKTAPKAIDAKTTPEQVAAAEVLSNEGKAAFRKGDPATARAKFDAAIKSNPDPRYMMNLCLAEEALKNYDAALATCQRVIDAKSDQRLAEKAQARIALIEQTKDET